MIIILRVQISAEDNSIRTWIQLCNFVQADEMQDYEDNLG